MDACNTTKKERTLTIQEGIKEVQERIERHLLGDRDLEKEWTAYSSEAPSVDEFNSPNFGKTPFEDVEPEVFTMSSVLTPETKEKILQEFLHAATVAQVKPIEGHVCQEGYGEVAMCPILNNPDEIMVKIQEVFHTGETVMDEEDGVSDKHFILGYIQSKLPKRKLGWREGSLYVDGARTNITKWMKLFTRKMG